MRKKSLRLRIAMEAAKLIVEGRESDYTTAKRRAARILGVRFSLDDFPSTREIQSAVRHLERLSEEGVQSTSARDLHLSAIRLLRQLKGWESRFVQPLPGCEVRTGLETTIAVVSPSVGEVNEHLRGMGYRPRIVEGDERHETGRGVLLVPGPFPAKVLVFEDPKRLPVGMTQEELTGALAVPGKNIEFEVEGVSETSDRFLLLEDILFALEEVRLEPATHPEGDALHHALQLFDLVRAEAPYDEEMLSAALLHDVGILGTTSDRLRQTETLLDRLVTHRTLRLIEALLFLTEEIPPREGRAFVLDDDEVADANRLAELDRLARVPGGETSSAEEAVAYLRSLEEDDWWRDESVS